MDVGDNVYLVGRTDSADFPAPPGTYQHPGGGSDAAIVKLTADNGLVGWGECTRAGDAAGIESAVKSMAPILMGRDPWDKEAIARDVQADGLRNRTSPGSSRAGPRSTSATASIQSAHCAVSTRRSMLPASKGCWYASTPTVNSASPLPRLNT